MCAWLYGPQLFLHHADFLLHCILFFSLSLSSCFTMFGNIFIPSFLQYQVIVFITGQSVWRQSRALSALFPHPDRYFDKLCKWRADRQTSWQSRLISSASRWSRFWRWTTCRRRLTSMLLVSTQQLVRPLFLFMYHVTGTGGIACYDVFDRELKSMFLNMCYA